jgi:hypothetical protein
LKKPGTEAIIPRFEINGDVTRIAALSDASPQLPEAPFILDHDRLPLVTKNGHQSGHQYADPPRATITARAAVGSTARFLSPVAFWPNEARAVVDRP